jgi:hypothetical protein
LPIRLGQNYESFPGQSKSIIQARCSDTNANLQMTRWVLIEYGRVAMDDGEGKGLIRVCTKDIRVCSKED